jgi:hypothetical protein
MASQELYFNTTAITQVGSTAKRTTIVLPSAQRKQQKIAVGDDTGVITCFTAKRGVYEARGLRTKECGNNLDLKY